MPGMGTAAKNSEYPMYELEKLKAQLVKEGKKIYDFGTGDPREKTPKTIREAFIKSVPEISQYPTIKGRLGFREACAGWLNRRFKVVLDPKTQIIPLTGAKEGIFHITPVLVNPEEGKDTIIIAVPGYQVPQRSAQAFGVNIYTVELNESNNWKLDLAEIDPNILKRSAAVWFNYPHNPTGQTVNKEFFEQQVRIAREYSIVICSDETYVDLYLDDDLPPSVLEIGTEGILAFHSCSKRSAMTGYRSGFLAGDEKILTKYLSIRSAMGVATPVPTQVAAEIAWSDDEHVAEKRGIFNSKRKLLESFLKEKGIEFLPTKATFYLWCKTPAGKSSLAYTAELAKKGIIISPESHFLGLGDNYFRIALVPTIEDCKQAIDIWKEI